MKDAALFGALIVAFAVLVTAHVTIVWTLARRPPRWRALAALVLVPLAPYFASRERMRVRAAAWVGALLVYAVARWTQR